MFISCIYNGKPNPQSGLSGIFKKDSGSKDSLSNLKSASSVASVNSLSDSGLASAGGAVSAGGAGPADNVVT